MKIQKLHSLALTILALSITNNAPAKEPTPIQYPNQNIQEGLFGQLSAARRTKALNHFKQLHATAFSAAIANKGKFPASKVELIEAAKKSDVATPETIDWPKKGDKLTYVPGFGTNSKHTTILLHSKPDTEGKRIVCLINGSCQTYSKEKFETQIKVQSLKLEK